MLSIQRETMRRIVNVLVLFLMGEGMAQATALVEVLHARMDGVVESIRLNSDGVMINRRDVKLSPIEVKRLKDAILAAAPAKTQSDHFCLPSSHWEVVVGRSHRYFCKNAPVIRNLTQISVDIRSRTAK